MGQKPLTYCQTYGQHDFRVTYTAGWYQCHRERCRAYAVCPECVGSILSNADITFCQKHLHLTGFVYTYPVRFIHPTKHEPTAQESRLWEGVSE